MMVVASTPRRSATCGNRYSPPNRRTRAQVLAFPPFVASPGKRAGQRRSARRSAAAQGSTSTCRPRRNPGRERSPPGAEKTPGGEDAASRGFTTGREPLLLGTAREPADEAGVAGEAVVRLGAVAGRPVDAVVVEDVGFLAVCSDLGRAAGAADLIEVAWLQRRVVGCRARRCWCGC